MREPSTGELAENFRELRLEFKEGLVDLRNRLRDLDIGFNNTFIRKDLYQAEKKALEGAISAIELAQKASDDVITKRLDRVDDERLANKRLALSALVLPIVVFLVIFILTRVLTP